MARSDPDPPPRSARRPAGFDGENIGALITVDWKPDYHTLAQIALKQTLSKEDYLVQQVVPLIDELVGLLSGFGIELPRLERKEIEEDEFLSITRIARDRIHDLYVHSTTMSLSPYECSDMDTKLEQFVAHMDNMVLFFSERGLEIWPEESRLKQALQYRGYARETLNHLRYELTKVR